MARICDLMHKGVIFCYPGDTAKDVVKIMDSNHIRSVIVVDENGEVWGLISIMDMIKYHGEDLEKILAKDIMKTYKIDVDPLWPIEKAVEIMKKNKFEQLIIVDPNAGPRRPVAIITTFDIVQYMSGIKMGKFEQMLKLSS